MGLTTLVSFIVVLGVLITIHEFGHFLACRLTGVKVEKFSIGFGPELFHWQSKETRFVVSLLPLGGFVKPAGETIGEVKDGELKEGDYLNAPIGSRIFIVSAGVIMNYILAFVLFFVIYMMGRPIPSTTIGELMEGYPAAESGIQVGDKIKDINGQPVSTWIDLIEFLDETDSTSLQMNVDRAGDMIPVVVQPKIIEVTNVFGEKTTVKRLGVKPSADSEVVERYGIFESMQKSWETGSTLTVMTHRAIFALITGQMSVKSLSGPVGIAKMAGDAAERGVPHVLNLMAVLSISLAVLNLLPLPALDGGHLLFLLIEAVRRKRVSLEVQEKATQVGFVLLLGLMFFVIYSDLEKMNIFSRVAGMFTGS